MANLGTKRTEETRAKMSKSQGQTCKSYWRASSFFFLCLKTLSAYTLAKMSTVKSGANNPSRRAVNILVFSVDGQLVNEFSTLTEAALWLNTSVTF